MTERPSLRFGFGIGRHNGRKQTFNCLIKIIARDNLVVIVLSQALKRVDVSVSSEEDVIHL